jgi:hypothetical protein
MGTMHLYNIKVRHQYVCWHGTNLYSKLIGCLKKFHPVNPKLHSAMQGTRVMVLQ